jgi:hypothetical protein
MSSIRPVVSILDPNFRYIPASQTDVSKTFERIRMEMGISNPVPRHVPAMFSSVADVSDEDLAFAAAQLRQDYEEYGDPWYPRKKGGI